MGERAGNAPLASVIAVLNDYVKVETSVDEMSLYTASKLVETFSGLQNTIQQTGSRR